MSVPLIQAANVMPHNSKKKKSHATYASLMRYARLLNYGDIYTRIDKKTGLNAIVAINNLTRGPAIGGCRMATYASTEKALEDVLRLGYLMSYKASINDLPHGGAKAVIIRPKGKYDRTALLEQFGEFVNDIGGSYITAVDSGTTAGDMDIIARKTPFVTCTSAQDGGDPSPFTALGVLRGIEAAIKWKLNKDSVEGVQIAVQGVGHVGHLLARLLHERGARLTITDVDLPLVQQVAAELKVDVCSPEAIYDLPVDVFAPCALGAVVNLKTINRLKAKIIAGAANNQLAHSLYGALLHERGILYAPDFLINAGGLIHGTVTYDQGSLEQCRQQILDIYHTTMDIFERAAKANCSPNDVAIEIARERLR